MKNTHMIKKLFLTSLMGLAALSSAFGQIDNQNKNGKFLGNITTTYENWQEYCDLDCNNYKYSDYWEQVTCENATKWGSVHSGFGQFNWNNADRTYNYCKSHGLIFKFHALIWGSQYPSFIKNLSVADTKKAIIEWYDEVAKHYPDLKIIDVVNEAVFNGANYHSPYKETKIIEALTSLANDRLGTNYQANTNGYKNDDDYQWIAEAFRLARERWPNAILIYNDYNTFDYDADRYRFINLVKGLKACKAPIDAAGCQSHDLNDMSGSRFKKVLEEVHNSVQLPIYITEYDICKTDDDTQLTRYKEQFPILWEADYVAGVTLWGWQYGKTWVEDNGVKGASGLVKDCKKRPAFTWLEQYMKTDAAKNAPCVAVGGPSVNVSITCDEPVAPATITISAEASKEIWHVDMYLDGERMVQKYVRPFVYDITGVEAGTHELYTIAVDSTTGKSYKSSVTTIVVNVPQSPFNGSPADIPGVVEAEEFDFGGEGYAYHDKDVENRNGETRKEGVDMSATAVGYCEAGEWMEYTVNIQNAGPYNVSAYLAGENGTGSLQLYLDGKMIGKEFVSPNTGDYTSFKAVSQDIDIDVTGEHVLKVEIVNPWFDIDKIVFKSLITGVDFVAADNEVVSSVFVNVFGQEVNPDRNMFLIRKDVLRNGTVKYTKVIK